MRSAAAGQPIKQLTVPIRGLLSAALILCCGASEAGAQLHRIFPWFHRAEPAIESQVFRSQPGIRIDGRRIGILPFPAGQEGQPVPPPFSSFLRNALYASASAGSVVDIDDPSGILPEAERERFGDTQRMALALDRSKAAGADLLASGRVEAVFRTASGGMVIKISARLWDVESCAQVWSGRISVNWIRRYPLEDCLLRAAITLVEEWNRGGGV